MKHILSPYSKSKLTNVEAQDSQPNACDLRLDRVLKINNRVFILSEDEKRHRGSEEYETDAAGYFYLTPGHYEVIMANVIEVGAFEAGWVITRSTLNRNGVFITSGLYDSGYHGAMAACLHVTCGDFKIKKGTRIGQYLSFGAEMLSEYNGSYGFNKDGTAKEEEKKYHKE